MVPTMDQVAVEGFWVVRTMDKEADEGAMDQEAVEGAMDQEAVEGFWVVRWIRKERWMVSQMDQEAVEGAMDGTTDE